MSNTKKKNNVRTGGAVLSTPDKDIEFINTGHAAQARYLAALANPFASPAVPIPDSFLEAHVSKIGHETTLTGCTAVELKFYRTSDEVTGDYQVDFKVYSNSTWTTLKTSSSEIGARIVAGGISFEDVGKRDSIQGVVSYVQVNSAFDGSVSEEVSRFIRMSRNEGYGTILYEPADRRSLDFEGNYYVKLGISFSTATDVILRFVALVETDGAQGFVESKTSDKDFVITNSYLNHHAGIFADTPLPDLDHSLIEPSHTNVTSRDPGHHTAALTAAAHWVSSAIGWAWKHKDMAANFVRKAPQYYQALTNFGGSVIGSSGQIMALGARAAPLAIGI